MQVGMIFHGTQNYGGHYHSLGLFQVVKIGAKFASMKAVKSQIVAEISSQASGLESSRSTQCRACAPITFVGIKAILVCLKDYDCDKKQVFKCDGGTGCYKDFELVAQDANGHYSFISSAQSYY